MFFICWAGQGTLGMKPRILCMARTSTPLFRKDGPGGSVGPVSTGMVAGLVSHFLDICERGVEGQKTSTPHWYTVHQIANGGRMGLRFVPWIMNPQFNCIKRDFMSIGPMMMMMMSVHSHETGGKIPCSQMTCHACLYKLPPRIGRAL
jgi:hypothetical protein